MEILFSKAKTLQTTLLQHPFHRTDKYIEIYSHNDIPYSSVNEIITDLRWMDIKSIILNKRSKSQMYQKKYISFYISIGQICKMKQCII